MLLESIISTSSDSKLKEIAQKVFQDEMISTDDGLYLYEKADLGYLAVWANYIREQKHEKRTYYNRNFHIEPTNICIHGCKFCSYSRKEGEEGSWELSISDIEKIVESYKNKLVTEVHIVGGVYSIRDIHYYCSMINAIKNIMPEIHVKAFTAVEIDYMITKSGMTLKDGLLLLKKHGLDSIPGGGAEILDEEIRKKICPNKSTSAKWLEIHKTCHELGIPTNATILYGHIENYSHRIDHMNRLREIQKETNGFMSFIPLKFKKSNNELSVVGEVTTLEDLRNYCVSRIFLSNIPHLKAYWPMIGKEVAQLSLDFGVDDLDGTIDDTTKIYSMAGAKELSPTMNTEEIIDLIEKAGKTPVERNSIYSKV